jgi:hypothetical protein
VGLVVIEDAAVTTASASANNAPVWDSTANPSFVVGVGGSYNLNQNASDPEDTLIFTLSSASPSLPSGVTLSSAGIIAVSSAAVSAITSGVLVEAYDGVNTSVTSDPFNISIISQGARRWHPGHYLKVQGKPADTDQDTYYAEASASIANNMNDSVYIKGAYMGIAWGTLNPSGSNYDWTRVDQMLDLVGTTYSKKLIIQIQSKTFSPDQTYMGPADLLGQSYETFRGWNMALWRNGTGGFPDVMGRYIDFWTAFINRYDSDARLEVVTGVETAPSGGPLGLPADYNPTQMDEQLQRWHTAMAGVANQLNFSCNINSLGGGAGNNNKVPGLMENAYQLGLMHNGPDAKEADGYLCFEGVATGPVLPVRDYRGLMGAMYIASEDVMGTGTGDLGKLPAQIIIDELDHQTTHLGWVPSVQNGPTTWQDVIDAIEANPVWTSACPSNYVACNTS